MQLRYPVTLMKLTSLLFVFRHRGIQHRNMAMLKDVGVTESSIRKYLIGDPAEPKTGDKIAPREMRGAHYISVIPEPVTKPSLVIASQNCMDLLNIDRSEATTELFASVFGGNTVLPNMGTPYCTTYGCHSFGHYFGQMGDGRAVTIGEMLSRTCKEKETASGDVGHYSAHIQELQLKGGGRSPCSRGFDGRAVLRSCTREFLVSEAMHHLGIPTTRALSIIATGEPVTRAWYSANSSSNTYAERIPGGPQNMPKFPPDRLFREPGAVLCRVSRSFLRFGHLELFGMRKEYKELIRMADYVCFKEYPHLLSIGEQTVAGSSVACENIATVQLPKSLPTGSPQRYVSLYRSVAHRSAALIANWLRVGYVHGNMNSDNCLLSGSGLDYGPFGWMENYNRDYQPFTTDRSGDFRFCNQANAMQLNVIVMGEAAFSELVLQTSKVKYDKECEAFLQEIKDIGDKEFETVFQSCYDDVKRRKLGLLTFTSDDSEDPPKTNNSLSDSQLWGTLEALMHRQGCDFTILFRELSKAADLSNEFTNNVSEEQNREVAAKALRLLAPSVYDTKFEIDKNTDWINWMEHYLFRIKAEGQEPEERKSVQNKANPKYVLRNWMSTLAYESALEGDYSVLEELHTLLQQPYEDQSQVMQSKWYSKTPTWARNLPGVAFLSCSS